MSLYVFGSNTMYQLGLPEDVESTHIPTKHEFFEDKEIEQIACGRIHSMVLCKGNKLYTWGVNDDYALGRDGEEEQPELVDFSEQIVMMAGGASFSALLTKKGHVYGCGTFKSTSGVFGFSDAKMFQEKFTRIKPLKQIKAIYSGSNHLVMIDKSNAVWTVGANESGQLGTVTRPRRQKHSLTPNLAIASGKNKKYIKASGGGFHSFAINAEHQAIGWGSNYNGQLGHASNNQSIERTAVDLESVENVYCGLNHTIFITADKTVLGCGENAFGQCGTEGEKLFTSPRRILENADRVRTGSDHTIAQIGNKLYGWGCNMNGELGCEDEEVKAPKEISFDFAEIVDFQCGSDFTLVLTK
ncbi:regulator of chromosome condensation [Enteropsectra breve]|nr:regulator of chromosome condensation [Enteropsectra breve]